MSIKLGQALLLMWLLLAHQAASQTAADSSDLADSIADNYLDFGAELSDTASTVSNKVSSATSKAADAAASTASKAVDAGLNATSKAADVVANATSTAASSAANATMPAGHSLANQTSSAVVTAANNATEKLEGKELDAAVEANSGAQSSKASPKSKVVAQVVEQEPAAELANGDADLSRTGICEKDIDTFCMDVTPGLGRLAICLSDQIKEEGKEGYSGAKVTKPCRTELDTFRKDQSGNINLDLPLAKACLNDVQKLCSKLEPGESALSCLRDQKDQVSGKCASEILIRQEDAADDFRLDKELFDACQDDAQSVCSGVDPHEGRVQECLRERRSGLSYDCQAELFRQDQEDSEDLRLSVRLFHKCLNDKIKFCGDVPPGNARAKECLEQHREDADFSKACKDELESMITARSADFRLDPQLKTHCVKDIEELCMPAYYEVADLPDDHAEVITCLQDFRDEIKDPSCQARVTRTQEVAASDIRFDIPLAEACHQDRQLYCSGVAAGSARVIRCLQDRRQDLTAQCSAELFDEEVGMAESIDFQIRMKTTCKAEIKTFCRNVPHGHARVIRCLQDNLKADNFTKGCQAEVQKYEQTASTDYRLNFRLTQACDQVLKEVCTEVCMEEEHVDKACGGTVLRCLADKIEDITDEACKSELLYFQKMEVKDFRNDVILAEACRQDVDIHCSEVTPGDGKVHKCLVDHQDQLTAACRAETNHLSMTTATNVELNPSLGRACAPEMKAHCRGVTPGKARVLNCLLANADKMNATETCRSHLLTTQASRLSNWRLDYGLRSQCKADVKEHCAAEQRNSEDAGSGAVVKCLVANNQSLTSSCLSEVQRVAASALLLYQPDQPVTSECDKDVMSLCLRDKGLDTFPIGQVKQCLVNLGVPEDPSILLAAEAEAAEAAPTASNLPGAGLKPGAAEGSEADKAASGRKLLESLLSAATLDELQRRRLAQTGASLSPRCQALVLLAEPTDAFARYQTSLSASTVSAQVESLEAKLGLAPGTLTSTNNKGLTLSGLTAVFGMVAITVVSIAGAVFAYRRYKGLDKHSGYTMVKKARGKQLELGSTAST